MLRTRHGSEEDVPQKPADGKAYGSSGNATFTDEHGQPIEGGPLFEEDGPTTNPEDSAATENPDAGLAKIGDATDASTDAINDAAKAVDGMAQVDPDVQPDTQCMGSIRKSMKRSLGFGFGESVELGMGREFCRKYMLENAEGFSFRRNDPFKLGDVVQADGIPMLFVVKASLYHAVAAVVERARALLFVDAWDGQRLVVVADSLVVVFFAVECVA